MNDPLGLQYWFGVYIDHGQRINGLEISLGMIPAGHPFLDPRQLEAEATGLLDRMLSVLQDNSRYACAQQWLHLVGSLLIQ